MKRLWLSLLCAAALLLAAFCCFALARAAVAQQTGAPDASSQRGGQTAHYRQHGPAVLNDLGATPGDVRTSDTRQLCAASFHTGTVRNVPESVKHAVCRAYGLAPAQCTGQKVEIDHLISLELGGSNELKNLWPQPYAPRPGAKEKDVVENWLHRQVCSGALTLGAAQLEIRTDWYAVYLQVPQASGGGAK